VNFYEDGQNFSLASLMHVIGPTIFGAEQFEWLQAAFQRAMKEKSTESLKALVEAARRTRWQQLPEALGPIAHGSSACLSAISTPGLSTDAAMVVLGALISRLETMSSGPYRIEHDQSKNLERYHELLHGYIEHDQPAAFRATTITQLTFPLKLQSVVQVDSKNSPAVQLADVMIGAALEAASRMIGQRQGGLDPQALISLYRDDQIIHMLPSIDFDEQKRLRRGTQANEIIDYFGEHFGHRFPGAVGKR
jgi:hypothetical protein